jgi:hypothetical protein
MVVGPRSGPERIAISGCAAVVFEMWPPMPFD